ncbi:MAG: hypothetical protein ACFCUS_09325 [Rubrimonas sp.]|uniref:hypothetical protein n=1 Tax=Rubrimonas sp. TaxID=2036015 RepID=UPI002FDD9EC3
MRPALALAALALAGCADSVRVFNASPIPQHRADISRAATGGIQALEVHGAPPDGAAPEAVAAATTGPAGFRPTRYALAAPGEGGLRTVFEFGGAAGGQASCRAPRGSAQAPGADMQIAATLCQGSGDVSTATLRAPGVAGPSSPGYEAAVRALLRELLTPERPQMFPRFLR